MEETRTNPVGTNSVAAPLLRKVLRSAVLLGVLAVATKCLSFLEKLYQASSLGTSSSLDAYLVAISVPLAMFVFTREVVEPAVLPVYMDLRARRGAREAGAFVAGAGAWILICGGTVVGLLLANLAVVIHHLAPGLPAAEQALAVRLSRGTFPAGLWLSLSALTGIVLNAHRRFVLPASADLARTGVLVLGFGFGVSRFGLEKMSIFFAIACAARLAVHLPSFFRLCGLARPLDLRDPATALALRLAAPLLLGMAFSQAAGFVDNYFASQMGAGTISGLSFGRKLVDLPLLLVSYSISVVAFPYFADFHVRRTPAESMLLLRRLLVLTAIGFAWITALCVPLAHDLVSVALKRGAFGDESVALTARILSIYSVGLVPLAVESILVQHYFARQDVLRPVLLGIGSVILHVAVLAAGWRLLGPPALALGYVIGKTTKVAFLIRLLPAGQRSIDPRLLAGLLAVTLITAAVVALLRFSSVVTAWSPLVRLASLGAVGTGIFVLAGAAACRMGIAVDWGRPAAK